MKYGILTKDCCGCDALQCIDCEPPERKEDLCPVDKNASLPLQKPLDCYNYNAHHRYAADHTSCWQPQCLERPSDAPNDEVRIASVNSFFFIFISSVPFESYHHQSRALRTLRFRRKYVFIGCFIS